MCRGRGICRVMETRPYGNQAQPASRNSQLRSISIYYIIGGESRVVKQLHDAIYRLRHSKSLIHILSLSNSYNNIASIKKNRGDKLYRVIVALPEGLR